MPACRNGVRGGVTLQPLNARHLIVDHLFPFVVFFQHRDEVDDVRILEPIIGFRKGLRRGIAGLTSASNLSPVPSKQTISVRFL